MDGGLLYAAYRGDVKRVVYLLEEKRAWGLPLIYEAIEAAVYYSHLEIAGVLLKKFKQEKRTCSDTTLWSPPSLERFWERLLDLLVLTKEEPNTSSAFQRQTQALYVLERLTATKLLCPQGDELQEMFTRLCFKLASCYENEPEVCKSCMHNLLKTDSPPLLVVDASTMMTHESSSTVSVPVEECIKHGDCSEALLAVDVSVLAQAVFKKQDSWFRFLFSLVVGKHLNLTNFAMSKSQCSPASVLDSLLHVAIHADNGDALHCDHSRKKTIKMLLELGANPCSRVKIFLFQLPRIEQHGFEFTVNEASDDGCTALDAILECNHPCPRVISNLLECDAPSGARSTLASTIPVTIKHMDIVNRLLKDCGKHFTDCTYSYFAYRRQLDDMLSCFISCFERLETAVQEKLFEMAIRYAASRKNELLTTPELVHKAIGVALRCKDCMMFKSLVESNRRMVDGARLFSVVTTVDFLKVLMDVYVNPDDRGLIQAGRVGKVDFFELLVRRHPKFSAQGWADAIEVVVEAKYVDLLETILKYVSRVSIDVDVSNAFIKCANLLVSCHTEDTTLKRMFKLVAEGHLTRLASTCDVTSNVLCILLRGHRKEESRTLLHQLGSSIADAAFVPVFLCACEQNEAEIVRFFLDVLEAHLGYRQYHEEHASDGGLFEHCVRAVCLDVTRLLLDLHFVPNIAVLQPLVGVMKGKEELAGTFETRAQLMQLLETTRERL